MITRTVDLEGIATDGYGYSVTITAPGGRRQPKPKYMWRVPKFTLGRINQEPDPPTDPSDGLAIPMTREVNVRESWKAPPEKDVNLTSASGHSSDLENAIDHMDLEYLGESASPPRSSVDRKSPVAERAVPQPSRSHGITSVDDDEVNYTRYSVETVETDRTRSFIGTLPPVNQRPSTSPSDRPLREADSQMNLLR